MDYFTVLFSIFILTCIIFLVIAVHDSQINTRLVELEISLMYEEWDCDVLDMFIDKADKAILFKIDQPIKSMKEDKGCEVTS